MNLEQIEKGVRMILEGIGEDISREGLVETPRRVAEMYAEIFASTGRTNEDIARDYSKVFCEKTDSQEIVTVADIPAFSWCEHHMAIMYDMKVTVSYIPNGYIIGLSKIPRIVDAVCRRLQLQERIGHDIMEIVRMAAGTQSVRVEIEGRHACVAARGIRSNSVTRTCVSCGAFKSSSFPYSH